VRSPSYESPFIAFESLPPSQTSLGFAELRPEQFPFPSGT
jgi:hypothetical protein